MATNKTFGFGGDASRHSDWTVRLPVYIHNKCGYMEFSIVEGSTPLLVGRPFLQALKVQMNYKDNLMSIQDGPWTEVPIGERGGYLLTTSLTSPCMALISNYGDLSEYIDIHEYLSATGRQPPE